ncbi:MAG: SDR family oxidoreductase [Polyangiaceae bacterium]|nr:SDR family oxidoreductase [Polyangiaceae bacterium]
MSGVAFITGGSRGIGRALVDRFKALGFRVAAVALRQAPEGVDLGLRADVSDAAQVRAAIARTVAELGGLDAVINNAGVAGSNSLDPDASDELWHRILAVNLDGTYHVCKHALPHLPDGRGRILNIASVLGLRGVPDQTAYCAAKHAVIGLTRSLAQVAAPRGITVNAICPGWVRTEMAAARMRELGVTEAELARSVPLGRFVEPGEVADLAAYLVSGAARNVTGQALLLDGGAGL